MRKTSTFLTACAGVSLILAFVSVITIIGSGPPPIDWNGFWHVEPLWIGLAVGGIAGATINSHSD